MPGYKVTRLADLSNLCFPRVSVGERPFNNVLCTRGGGGRTEGGREAICPNAVDILLFFNIVKVIIINYNY